MFFWLKDQAAADRCAELGWKVEVGKGKKPYIDWSGNLNDLTGSFGDIPSDSVAEVTSRERIEIGWRYYEQYQHPNPYRQKFTPGQYVVPELGSAFVSGTRIREGTNDCFSTEWHYQEVNIRSGSVTQWLQFRELLEHKWRRRRSGLLRALGIKTFGPGIQPVNPNAHHAHLP